MTPQQMAETLRQLALILKTSDVETSDVLVGLGNALEHATGTLTAIDRKVKRRYPQELIQETAPSAFATSISNVFLAAGARSQANDFAVVAGLLCHLGSMRGDEVHDRITTALTTPVQPATPPPAPAARELADQLTAASTDNQKFDALVLGLRQLPKPILTSVANRYLGNDGSYKSKEKAIRAIKSRQFQDATQISKERRIEKITV